MKKIIELQIFAFSVLFIFLIDIQEGYAQSYNIYRSIAANPKKQYNEYLNNSFNHYYNKTDETNRTQLQVGVNLTSMHTTEPFIRTFKNFQFKNQAFQNSGELSSLSGRISSILSNSKYISDITRTNREISSIPVRTIVVPVGVAGVAPIFNNVWSTPLSYINIQVHYIYQRPLFNSALWNEIMARERQSQLFTGIWHGILLPTPAIISIIHPTLEFWHGENLLGSVWFAGEILRSISEHFIFEKLEMDQEFTNILKPQAFKWQ